VLAFERANRDYFAASISDRGDEYFDQFAERHQELAATQHGLGLLEAKVARENIASQKVLTKAGFVPAGPADIGGRAGVWYQRAL
jgi:RimJ/RimL family protein N-acetyltransferase